MCGRFFLTSPPDEMRATFGYREQPNFPPRYNIAPTQPIAVITHGPHFTLKRWGFVPAWVKDFQAFSLLINARVETVAEKASFRHAIRRRRCLIPANGYYEWRRAGKAKVPFKIALPGHRLVAFAAIHETWMGAGGEELDTAALLTQEAQGALRSIHDRMPLILSPEQGALWLADDEMETAAAIARALAASAGGLEAVAISDRVNKVNEDDASLHDEDHGIARPTDLFG